MARDQIDDILNELGLDAQTLDAPVRQTPKAPAKPTPQLPSSGSVHDPSPLPAAPSNQSPETLKSITPTQYGSGGEALRPIYTPAFEAEQMHGEDDALGDRLVATGAITGEELAAAEQVLRQTPGSSLAMVLINRGTDEESVLRTSAELAGVRFERIPMDADPNEAVEGTLLQRLTIEYCKEQQIVPLRREGARVVIGAIRAEDVFLADDIKRRLGVASVKLVQVTPGDVKHVLDMLGGGDGNGDDISDILSDVEESDVEVAKYDSDEAVDLEAKAGESPVIRYVNYIIQTAVKEGASDIHIEPAEKRIKVRFRIDGVLFEMMNPPAGMSAAITSRLKIMANLDISERRIPQDGRIRCTVAGRKLDLRVSTLPTPYGEKTVMRILDTRSINVDLEKLGFEPQTFEVWCNQVKMPHGIVLVTGPTGSGKTTTLYASIRQLDKQKLNISTVEDPVEYHLDGITQTQTHERIGMTFAKALKALLRQDPDVIMIGEIRDGETAHTAIQAALTGHLVMSTLHTNDAPSSITRLVNIGLEPFLVGAAVNAVLAQRLGRRLCAHCKMKAEPSEEMADFLENQGFSGEQLWTPKGCDKCRSTGYSGRVGLYELLTVDDQLRDVIARNPNVSEFRRMCIDRGMVTLRQDGMKKVREGLTTVQEVLRVADAG